ncbi:GD10829 [Drosophila simulans]|uniref:GD10829 n=1 Tax=Drosophila simulans TaxID=7240 RepID=B4QC56_DROSI|nr:GD10829 [Drosophila simulans]
MDKQASDDEDNEIEIVEPKTDTITIESDNEDDMPSTSTATQQKQPQETAIMKITSVTSEAAKNELQENNQTDIDVAAFSSTILASLLEVEVNEGASEPKPTSPGQKKQPRKKTTNNVNPALLALERPHMEDMKKSDAKLKMKVMVNLKRAEDEFEVARKWVEDMKREQELATKIKDSKAATPSNKTKNPSENLKISETGSSAKKENKKRHGEVDKENTKNKEKIGDILKAAIKAKIGENEKHMAEDEHLPVDELLTDKDKELDKEKSTSTEPEKNNTSGIEKEADKEQHSIKENIVKGEKLLACALDEVIAMEGIELGDDTEELIKALGSPSVLASENTKDNETDLDANDFIENLPLETTEPPEILLKEDEIKVEKPTGTSQVGASSPAENGDTEMESTLEASDSAPDELATAEIVG